MSETTQIIMWVGLMSPFVALSVAIVLWAWDEFIK